MAQMVNVAGVMADSIVDGPGIRVAIFVQGCCHHCEGCHNPESWPFGAGTDMSVEELYTMVKANPLCRGVTFSGGDPLYPANREQVGALAREVHARFPEKTIWLYTGYRWEQIADLPFLDAIDVIVDGPFIESQKNTQLCWRGSANQRVIDVRRTRETGTVCLHENTDK